MAASPVSVLTLARGRAGHLHRMVQALARADPLPAELVVARLDDGLDALPDAPFPLRQVTCHAAGGPLPLAAAARLRARASGAVLLFLDVDCLPGARTIGAVAATLAATDAIVCPEVRYLSAAPDPDWTEAALAAQAVPHPARPFPAHGNRTEPNPGLLWSLAMAVRAERWHRLGGFDEGYAGYGAEDTDLGFAARAAGVPLVFIAGAPVFHQCHAVHHPPLQHFHDILRNATRFHGRWGLWPMDGWLAAFATLGLIDWSPDASAIALLRPPTATEVAASRQPDGTRF